MILVDINLLIYAEDSQSEHNRAARIWWDACLSGSEAVCLCWPVLMGFIRISTNLRAIRHPLTLNETVERIQSWLNQPCVKMIQPTEQHWKIFQQMLRAGNATANLVSDAHLAALAIEHNCVLYSTDRDFSRFRGLKWKNPIEED
jgi:toxin-antitoxin system PIN domain toxin